MWIVEQGTTTRSALRCGTRGRTVGRASFSSVWRASDPGGARVRSWCTKACSHTTCLSRGEATSVAVQRTAHNAGRPASGSPSAPRRWRERVATVRPGGCSTAHCKCWRSEVRRATRAACALQLGWLAIERAQPAEAIRYFGSARELSTDARTIVRPASASASRGPTRAGWSKRKGRFGPPALAAKTLDDPTSSRRLIAGLGRCLFWQGASRRSGDGIQGRFGFAGGGRVELARTGVALARVLIAEDDDYGGASGRGKRWNARRKRAMQRCLPRPIELWPTRPPPGATRPPRPAHIEAGLRVASRAHLPLHVARLRLAALEIASRAARRPTTAGFPPGSPPPRSTAPPLLRYVARAAQARVNGEELDADTRAFIEASGAATGQHGWPPGPNPVADLERLVSISQTAARRPHRDLLCRGAPGNGCGPRRCWSPVPSRSGA